MNQLAEALEGLGSGGTRPLPFSSDQPPETKEFDCWESELKIRADEAEGTFTGMGAVFGNKDFVGDIIERGAFRNSLEKFRKAGRLPPLLFSHDMSMPIGRFLDMEENSRGLKVKGRINLDTTKGRDVHALMKAGDVDGLSIGFRIAEGGAEFDDKRRIRRLKEIELLEVSVVALPANERARTTAVKSISPEMVTTKRELENALRDAGFSNSFAAYVAAGWQAPALRDGEGQSLNELLKAVRTDVWA
jgi:HK97 family phage prohead protease